MSSMTEMKDPRTLITARGWCYQILVQDPRYSFNYEVTVYHYGREIAESLTTTRWGARLAARGLRRRYYRRQRLTGETRRMR